MTPVERDFYDTQFANVKTDNLGLKAIDGLRKLFANRNKEDKQWEKNKQKIKKQKQQQESYEYKQNETEIYDSDNSHNNDNNNNNNNNSINNQQTVKRRPPKITLQGITEDLSSDSNSDEKQGIDTVN